MRVEPADFNLVARTRPPAKLNLFLELLARRDDGFHDIDTVMVPIDWCDEMRVRRTRQGGIQLHVHWLPSKPIIAQRLGFDLSDRRVAPLLDIPEDTGNLVYRALQQFVEHFDLEGGFDCDLGKRIPAGAGLGGASSNAAAALRCAATLSGISLDAPKLLEIAASIGSDVPFFLGRPGGASVNASRATCRWERLEAVDLTTNLHYVIVFPGVSLSTGQVYADSRVPLVPQNACRLITVLSSGDLADLSTEMMNRLTEPAKKLAPQINEILESLWRMGLRTCQLTGSGSACFAIASSLTEAKRRAAQIQAMHEPGAIVMTARSTSVPASVVVA